MSDHVADLVRTLRGHGVTFHLRDGRIGINGPVGVPSAVDEAQLRSDKDAVLKMLEMERQIPPAPTERRERARWLCAIASKAAVGAQELFDLIDATTGRCRTLGPYELDVREIDVVAQLLRERIGERNPIEPTATAPADGDGEIPRSIQRKHELGMSDRAFAELCRRTLGAPGLRSDFDDVRILKSLGAMPQ